MQSFCKKNKFYLLTKQLIFACDETLHKSS